MSHVRIIGAGRAGRALGAALDRMGWQVQPLVRRGEPLVDAAVGVDVVVIATPDAVISEVAAAVRPVPSTVVVHLSGAQGLDVLGPHPRRAALHPLVPLPTPERGADRLLSGITFAVAGDPVAKEMAELMGGRVVSVADEDRAAYHAAACIAANHVVALLGQVGRVAETAGLDLEAFVGLARAAVEDVAELGPGHALTGPASRGDWATLYRHLDALDPSERDGYSAGVALALRLAAGEAPSAGAVSSAPAETAAA